MNGTVLAAAALAATYAVTGFPYLPRRVLLHFAIAWPGVACVAAAGWLGGEAVVRRAMPPMLIGIVVLDAILTVKISQDIMFVRWDREIVVRRLEREHGSDLDLTDRGLGRSLRFKGYDDLNEQVITKRPTLFGYSPLVNRFHRKMEEAPILCQSALSANRIWFSPVATEVEWTAERFDQLVAESREAGPILPLRHRPGCRERRRTAGRQRADAGRDGRSDGPGRGAELPPEGAGARRDLPQGRLAAGHRPLVTGVARPSERGAAEALDREFHLPRRQGRGGPQSGCLLLSPLRIPLAVPRELVHNRPRGLHAAWTRVAAPPGRR